MPLKLKSSASSFRPGEANRLGIAVLRQSYDGAARVAETIARAADLSRPRGRPSSLVRPSISYWPCPPTSTRSVVDRPETIRHTKGKLQPGFARKLH